MVLAVQAEPVSCEGRGEMPQQVKGLLHSKREEQGLDPLNPHKSLLVWLCKPSGNPSTLAAETGIPEQDD